MSILKNNIPTDPPVARPRTIGEARELIRSVLDAPGNRWDESDQRRNCAMLGIEYFPLREMSPESLRVILDDFERRRMIIFND